MTTTTAVETAIEAARQAGASEARILTLELAAAKGADAATIETLAAARRVHRYSPVITLPAHRYEGLSRGRGWCRLGVGKSAVWGERVDGGYKVGPGKWVVGATDGYNRKDSTTWTVRQIMVGNAVWTIAD